MHIYIMNLYFEQRVNKKGAEKSMANCDKTKSNIIIKNINTNIKSLFK